VLRFVDLAASGKVQHAVMSRLGGISEPPYNWLNVSLSVGDLPSAVHLNRLLAISAADMTDYALVSCSQVHGNDIVVANSINERPFPKADALVTTQPGQCLAMAFADCLPIILVDATVPALALVHAGWRGSVAGVTLNAWNAMYQLGARADRTLAFFGPAIGGCCYEVGDEVARAALALGLPGESSLVRRNGRLYLDLAALNASLLAQAGIETIRSNICTACHRELFFSHRGDNGKTGRFAVYAGIIP